jgi:hypothetical protein
LREGRSYGASRYVGRSFWETDLDGIARLADPELIERRLTELRTEDLRGKQKQAAEAFKKAMKRKREGKPRTSIFDDE